MDLGANTLHIVQAPLTAEIVPPGPYMLLVLDDERVPSEAAMVMLTR